LSASTAPHSTESKGGLQLNVVETGRSTFGLRGLRFEDGRTIESFNMKIAAWARISARGVNGEPTVHRHVGFDLRDEDGRAWTTYQAWIGDDAYVMIPFAYTVLPKRLSLTIFADQHGRANVDLKIDLPTPRPRDTLWKAAPWPGLVAQLCRLGGPAAYSIGVWMDSPLESQHLLVGRVLGSSLCECYEQSEFQITKSTLSRIPAFPIAYYKLPSMNLAEYVYVQATELGPAVAGTSDLGTVEIKGERFAPVRSAVVRVPVHSHLRREQNASFGPPTVPIRLRPPKEGQIQR
jgi:hypothetical protein